jgi:hypothetical protein
VPDIFGQAQPSTGLGALTGQGFRSAGAGGLANIASILGASGITLRQADDSDEEDDDEELSEGDKNHTGPAEKLTTSQSGGDAGNAKAGYLDDKALSDDTKPVDVTDSLVGFFVWWFNSWVLTYQRRIIKQYHLMPSEDLSDWWTRMGTPPWSRMRIQKRLRRVDPNMEMVNLLPLIRPQKYPSLRRLVIPKYRHMTN